MLQKGQGCVRDPQKAFEWFKKAAEQGLAAAQLVAADALMSGAGTERDVETAAAWYEQAAAQGNEVAKQRLEALKQVSANHSA